MFATYTVFISELQGFFFYVYLFLRERQKQSASGEGQRERVTENPKQAPGSELSTQSPTQGLNPWTARS